MTYAHISVVKPKKETPRRCHLQSLILVLTKCRFLLEFTTFPIREAVFKYLKRLHFHMPGVQLSATGLITCLTTLQAVHAMARWVFLSHFTC